MSTPTSASPTPTSTPPPAPGDCPGDCDGAGQVTVDEVIRGVNIALGNAVLATCQALDRNVDGRASIDELIAAVRAVLDGCPAAAALNLGAARHLGGHRGAALRAANAQAASEPGRLRRCGAGVGACRCGRPARCPRASAARRGH